MPITEEVTRWFDVVSSITETFGKFRDEIEMGHVALVVANVQLIFAEEQR